MRHNAGHSSTQATCTFYPSSLLPLIDATSLIISKSKYSGNIFRVIRYTLASACYITVKLKDIFYNILISKISVCKSKLCTFLVSQVRSSREFIFFLCL